MVAVSHPNRQNLTGEKMQSGKPEKKEVRKLEGGRGGGQEKIMRYRGNGYNLMVANTLMCTIEL